GSCPWRTCHGPGSPGSNRPPPGPAPWAQAYDSYRGPLRSVLHPLIQHGHGPLHVIALGGQQRPARRLDQAQHEQGRLFRHMMLLDQQHALVHVLRHPRADKRLCLIRPARRTPGLTNTGAQTTVAHAARRPLQDTAVFLAPDGPARGICDQDMWVSPETPLRRSDAASSTMIAAAISLALRSSQSRTRCRSRVARVGDTASMMSATASGSS